MIWIMGTVGLLIWAVLQECLCRMGRGALAWGDRRRPQISITVDAELESDTRRLREILNAHDAPATFFMHDGKSEQTMLRRFAEWPKSLRAKCKRIAQDRELFYRPREGRPSLLTRVMCRISGRTLVLWDLDVESVQGASTKEIVEWILFFTQPGSILRFRAEDRRTENIVLELLPAFKRLNYQVVELSQMGLRPLGVRDAIQRSFQTYERYCNRVYKVQRVGFGPYDICRVERKPFEGPAVPGCPEGAPSMELHFESIRVAALDTFTAIRAFREGLRGIAEIVNREKGIRIVYAKSWFAPWTTRCHFHSFSLQWNDGLPKQVGGALLLLLYGEGQISLDRLLRPAKLTYMTRSEFLERWLRIQAPNAGVILGLDVPCTNGGDASHFKSALRPSEMGKLRPQA